jgi:hypothetical protein
MFFRHIYKECQVRSEQHPFKEKAHLVMEVKKKNKRKSKYFESQLKEEKL